MLRKTLRLACVTGLALMIQSCSWFEKDVYVIADVPEIENAFEMNVIWSTSVGDGVDRYFSSLAPAVSEERVFAASRDGRVAALDRKNGDKIWVTDLDDEEENDRRRSPRISGGVSLGFDKVFVGSENGYLYALDRGEGGLLWKFNAGEEIMSSPVSLADRVIVYTTSGRLIAVNDETGEEMWRTSDEYNDLSLRGTSNIAAVDGGKVLIYGTAQGKLNMVDSSNGALINSFIISLPKGGSSIDNIANVLATPMFLDGELVAVGYHGSLLHMAGAENVWKKDLSSYRDVANDYSDLFVTDEKGHVHSISRGTGEERWVNSELSYRDVTAPAVYNSHILVGDMDGYLYWLDSATGRIASMKRIDSDGLYIPPVIYDGVGYLQTRSGDIVAFTQREEKSED
ncbi:MAG: outer membrane protein assembly factor BamB [Succinivibrionaceae bacterium]|nr:outer membrane protein assembly factor BamB [Succinivibrionaceae bacterium]